MLGVQITTKLPKLLLKTTEEAYLSAYCPQLQETPSYQNLLPYCEDLWRSFACVQALHLYQDQSIKGDDICTLKNRTADFCAEKKIGTFCKIR